MNLVEKIDEYLVEEVLSESMKKQLDAFKQEHTDALKNLTSVADAQKARWDFIGKFVEAKIRNLGVDDKQWEKLKGWGISSPPKSTSKKLKGLSSKWNAFQRQAEKEAMKIQSGLGLSGRY